MNTDLSKYNPEGSVLRSAQMRMLDILIEVDKILKENKIEYWLAYGTCLGAVRHQGFIPWDDDLDIGVLKKDYKKIRILLQQKLPKQYVFQDYSTDPLYFYKFGKVRDKNSRMEESYWKVKEKGVFIDIFPVEPTISFRMKKGIDFLYRSSFKRLRNWNNTKGGKMLSYLVFPMAAVLATGARLLSKVAPVNKMVTSYGVPFFAKIYHDHVFPCKKITFEGHEFMGPQNVDAYLKTIYGDYMKIPEEQNRQVHALGEIELF
ncbi:MAG: phosphorylcholine transferase LicD [Prolixibacteraceae bacterium]